MQEPVGEHLPIERSLSMRFVSGIVVAATTIPKDSQVFLSYGNVSNMVHQLQILQIVTHLW